MEKQSFRGHVTFSSRLPDSTTMERRQTLHPTADPAANARSGIPMPASTIKAPQVTRAMGASRTSMFGSQSGVSGPRQSTIRTGSQNIDPILASVKKPGDVAFGRTPMSAKQCVHRATLQTC